MRLLYFNELLYFRATRLSESATTLRWSTESSTVFYEGQRSLFVSTMKWITPGRTRVWSRMPYGYFTRPYTLYRRSLSYLKEREISSLTIRHSKNGSSKNLYGKGYERGLKYFTRINTVYALFWATTDTLWGRWTGHRKTVWQFPAWDSK